MKIKLSGIKTTFEMENFELSIGKKEVKRLTKHGRKNRTDEELNLRKENDELRKRLNDAHSQLGDMRKQLEAARMDAMRK
jgi:uncharacterized protein YlxW (UPF0749 family)